MMTQYRTDDIKKRGASSSPNVFVTCGVCREFVTQLFLNCSARLLYGIPHSGECWVCPKSLEQFIVISFLGCGESKQVKFLWQCATHATSIVWCI